MGIGLGNRICCHACDSALDGAVAGKRKGLDLDDSGLTSSDKTNLTVGDSNEINALCRASVVLLSSHVDAFVKELGELALDSFVTKSVPRGGFSPRFFYHISKDIIDDLKEMSDHDKIAEKIFDFLSSDFEFWSKVGIFQTQISADRYNKGFSNPVFKKVRAYFNRFGYDSYQTTASLMEIRARQNRQLSYKP